MKKILSIISMLLLGSCLFAESVWVKVKSTKVFDRDSSRGKKIALISYGTELEVLGKSGKYLKITIADNGEQETVSWVGWVESKNTSSRVLKTSSSANAKEIALAGKGFNAEVEGLYEQETGLDFSRVDAIESIIIDIDELTDFIEEGNLKGAE